MRVEEDVDDRWALHASDRALLGNKTGATRLGFAILLKTFQLNGRSHTGLRRSPSPRSRRLPRSRCRPKPGEAMTGAAGSPYITAHKSATPSAFASPCRTILTLSRAGWKAKCPRWTTGQIDCWWLHASGAGRFAQSRHLQTISTD